MESLSLKSLDICEMEEIEGGKTSAFCKAVYVGDSAWALGAAANWWNPPGWAATVALVAVNGYCAFG